MTPGKKPDYEAGNNSKGVEALMEGNAPFVMVEH